MKLWKHPKYVDVVESIGMVEGVCRACRQLVWYNEPKRYVRVPDYVFVEHEGCADVVRNVELR